MSLYSFYAKIRSWAQPYWTPDPEKLPKPKPKQKLEAKPADNKPVKEKPADTQPAAPKKIQIEAVGRGETLQGKAMHEARGLRVVTFPRDLTDIWNGDMLPPPQHTWYYHSPTKHMLFSHLMPGSGYQFKERNNKARGRLRPLIYPQSGKSFDRTHLIPFGYHGSEADARLLIGWDSQQNRGPMNDFEQRQKRHAFPIFWLCDVEKIQGGAKLTYMTWDARNMRLLDSAEFYMNCPFAWKG